MDGVPGVSQASVRRFNTSTQHFTNMSFDRLPSHLARVSRIISLWMSNTATTGTILITAPTIATESAAR